MKNSKALKGILFFAGFIGVVVGAAILFMPIVFHAASDIELGSNASLLSEIRAPGGALLACGLLIMSGVFVERIAFTAAVVATVLYLSYGLSRVISIVLDGMPVEQLVLVAVMEIAIGLVCALFLIRLPASVS